MSNKLSKEIPNLNVNLLNKVQKNILIFEDLHIYLYDDEKINIKLKKLFELINNKQTEYDIFLIVTSNYQSYCERIISFEILDVFQKIIIPPLDQSTEKKLLDAGIVKKTFSNKTIGSYFYPIESRIVEYENLSELNKEYLEAYYYVSKWRKKNLGNVVIILKYIEESRKYSRKIKENLLSKKSNKDRIIDISEIIKLDNWIENDSIVFDSYTDNIIKFVLKEEADKTLGDILFKKMALRRNLKLNVTEFEKAICFHTLLLYPREKTYSQLIRISKNTEVLRALLYNFLENYATKHYNLDTYIYNSILRINDKILNEKINLINTNDLNKNTYILITKIKVCLTFEDAFIFFNNYISYIDIPNYELKVLYQTLAIKASRISDVYNVYELALSKGIEIEIGKTIVSKIIASRRLKKITIFLEDLDFIKIFPIIEKSAKFNKTSFSLFWGIILNALPISNESEIKALNIYNYINTYYKRYQPFSSQFYSKLIKNFTSFNKSLAAINKIDSSNLTISVINAAITTVSSIDDLRRIQQLVHERNLENSLDLSYYINVCKVLKTNKEEKITWQFYRENQDHINELTNNLVKQGSKDSYKYIVDLVNLLIKTSANFDESFEVYGVLYKKELREHIRITQSFFHNMFDKIEYQHDINDKIRILKEMLHWNLKPSIVIFEKYFNINQYGLKIILLTKDYFNYNDKIFNNYITDSVKKLLKSSDNKDSYELFMDINEIEKSDLFSSENVGIFYKYILNISNYLQAKVVYSYLIDYSLLSLKNNYKIIIRNNFYNYIDIASSKITFEELFSEIKWCTDNNVYLGIRIYKRLYKNIRLVEEVHVEVIINILSKFLYLIYDDYHNPHGNQNKKQSLITTFVLPLIDKFGADKFIYLKLIKTEKLINDYTAPLKLDHST